MCDKLDFRKSYWEGISEEAKDFVRALLEKDPAKRPSAKQALRHPWIQGHSGERCTGKQLSLSVVQRIQVPCALCTTEIFKLSSNGFLEAGYKSLACSRS